MSVLIRFEPPSLTTEQYDESIRRLEQGGDWPPDGLEYHVCFYANGQLRVSEVCSSREQWEAFGQRLMPLLEDIGIEPGEPIVLECHNTISG